MADAAVVAMAGGGVGCAVGAMAWRASGPHRRLPLRPLAVTGAVLAVVAGLSLRVPVLALAAPVAIRIATIELEQRERRAADRRRRIGLPIVVDAMVQQLRAGSGLRVVCAAPPAVGAEVDAVLRPLIDSLGRQDSLREAVAQLQAEASKRRWHDAQLFAATLAALVDRGGPAVAALQRLRLTLIGAVEAGSRAESQAGQAQASAALLAGAPALFALVVALADTDVGHFYLREPLGGLCVTAALLLSYSGWRWMSRDVDRAVLRHVDDLGGRRRRSRR